MNGRAHCDFDLAGGTSSRRKLEGRIGEGGARFELRTVNGSATIDRGLSTASAAGSEAPARRGAPAEAAPAATPAR